MFCVKCGTQLSDTAKFCTSCGEKTMLYSQTQNLNIDMFQNQKSALTPAKCTNCGANLQVDATQVTALCPFCNSAYVVQQAINNFNVNLNGNINVGQAVINVSSQGDINNLLIRAYDFERHNKFCDAGKYYNKVLDIDAKNIEAQKGIKRLDHIHTNYVFKTEMPVNTGFISGRLNLLMDRIEFIGKKKVLEYSLDGINGLSKSIGTMMFYYEGKAVSFAGGYKFVDRWIEYITNAKEGHFPPIMEDEVLRELRANIDVIDN